MSYSMRRALGEEPVTCANGFVATPNPAGGQQCVPDPSLSSEQICALDPNQTYDPNPTADGYDSKCSCNVGYFRDALTMKCGPVVGSCPEYAHMVSQDAASGAIECECDSGYQMDDYGKCLQINAASTSTPTWALVLGAAGIGLLTIGYLIR
jgi:hypothetical protein